MAPTRKTRKVNEKFVNVNEERSDKEGPGAVNKSKTKKRKLVDLVGAQWTKEELESFYDSYRKYGKDWKKVAGKVSNRTPDMVEALYNMNRAYLSLPEGAATAAGLIAMMTDHYSNLEGNNGENESDESPKKTSRKPPPKRGRGKQKTESKASQSQHGDLLSYKPVSSSFCSSGDSRPRAVGKRTPRISVGSIQNRDNRKLGSCAAKARQEDDEEAHMAAMALADVFQRGGSTQNCKSERNISKAVIFDDKGEGTLGSGEAAEKNSPNGQEKDMAAVGGRSSSKLTKSNKKKLKGITVNKSDDDQEDCNSIEGHNNSGRKGLKDDGDAKSPLASTSSPNGSRQLFFGDDESGALSALHTLADLSVNILQPTIAESGSSAEVKDDNHETDSKEKQSKPKASRQKDKRRFDGGEPDGGARKKTKTSKDSVTPEVNDSIPKPEKGKKCKSTPLKITKHESKSNMARFAVTKGEVPIEEENVTSRKGKHGNQAAAVSKPAGKFVTPVEFPPSTGNSVELQTKISSRRKSGIVKAFSKRENWNSETIADKRPSSYPSNSALDLKEKLSHTLSNSLFRRWCRFEWFYSPIDYPWFVQNEFVECLDHLKLGNMPRLTRDEWGFIRGTLGKPRRFSAQFLKKERDKLAKYRESVREYHSSWRTGKLEGLPTDLARPLIVGQHVIVCHPKFRELHDARILTVDSNCCRVQFDRPKLGVEFVLDIDSMPQNPVENMPEALRRKNVNARKFGDPKFVVPDNDWRAELPPRVSSSQSLEYASGPSSTATSHPTNTLLKQAKIQEREADVHALAELSRALNKKDALLMELRNMNEEFLQKEKETDSLSDLEHFKRQHTMVFFQLQEANDQVNSAVLAVRERNTYSRDTPNQLSRSTETYGEPSALLNSSGFNNNHSTGTQVGKIMENSRQKAKMMVDAAVQAMCTTNEGEDPRVKMGEVLDNLSNCNSGSGSGSSILRTRCIPVDSGDGSSTCQENPTSATFDPSFANADSSKMRAGLEGKVRFPSELISSCVSTFLMIQSCTEKQHPPAEVAYMLDVALSSLKPCCPENAWLYQDIESFINIIKNQMLALIRTPTPILPISVSLPPELPPI